MPTKANLSTPGMPYLGRSRELTKHLMQGGPTEPSAIDLAAINAEWPLIAAELDLLDAEIRMLYAEDHGGPTVLDWRRVRRAESRVTQTAADLAARQREHVCQPSRLVEVRMSADCVYGCKVVACQDCGAEQVSHRAAYGCPDGASVAA